MNTLSHKKDGSSKAIVWKKVKTFFKRRVSIML